MQSSSDSTETAMKEKITKAHCSTCGGERNCTVRGEHKQRGNDEFYQWLVEWQILECRGCETVFAMTSSTNSEDTEHFYNELGEVDQRHIEVRQYWPSLSQRSKPEWFTPLGIDAPDVELLSSSMLELYGALDNDLRTLSAIGIRTSFDVASELLKVSPDLSFEKKLGALVDLGKIGVADKDRLKVLVEAGSASVHRGWEPSPEDLNVLVEVLEHFVFHAFVEPTRRRALDEKTNKLKKTVPQRKSLKKGNKGN